MGAGDLSSVTIVDFGLAKAARAREKMEDVCGTLEYLPREVLLNLGYSFDVDLWTLGVLLFEMLVGRTPFVDPLMAENLQQQAIYQNILARRPRRHRWISLDGPTSRPRRRRAIRVQRRSDVACPHRRAAVAAAASMRDLRPLDDPTSRPCPFPHH